jgi:hypothetical protein
VKIRFTADVDVELAHAVVYHDRLSAGLGAEFAAEVGDGLPYRGVPRKRGSSLAARYRLRRFPYTVSSTVCSSRKLLCWQ